MRKTNKKYFSRKVFSANGLILVDGTMSYKKIVRKMKNTSYVTPAEGEIETMYMRYCPSIKVGNKKGGYIVASGAGCGAFLVKYFARKYQKLIVSKTNNI